ncbi:MAG: TIM barrel protein [Gemmatimonadota bacterium]|nr:TIM barrel protein [Gemmatimonadota bacterium]
MDRRTFVVTGAAGAGGLLTRSPRAPAAASSPGPEATPAGAGGREPFALDYAPHFGLFARAAGSDPIDQLRFMAERGFRSLEDNGMRERSVAEQERIAREMARLGLRMGVFVAHAIPWTEPQLTGGDPDGREAFLADIRASVEVAKRVNATWMTVVPGHVDLRLDPGYQTANVVESLRRAADILEPHRLVMVLEPLNPRDHPGLFLTKIAQAYEICRAVDSPSCKILDDLYHQQITEGNLIPNIDAAWDEIAYFQIGDNPGRNEPGTGEIHYANVFRHIRSRGYDGILGMEHGVAGEGVEGERAVIEAYRRVDPSG